jgi:hypothetical protein
MSHIRDQIIAEVMREIEVMEADHVAIVEALEQRGRRPGGSVVLSVRLEPSEVKRSNGAREDWTSSRACWRAT